MKTEEEAKKLWCPHWRYPGWPQDSNPSGGNAGATCIGSRCMMWEWEDELSANKHGWKTKADWRGNCGLTRGTP